MCYLEIASRAKKHIEVLLPRCSLLPRVKDVGYFCALGPDLVEQCPFGVLAHVREGAVEPARCTAAGGHR